MQNAESDSVHILCEVCGDKNHGRHYDVRTCKACALFFQRWHKVGKYYACHGEREHECLINEKSRKVCIPCRLKKCIDVGMNEDKLQPLRGIRKSPQRRYTDEADQQEDALSSPTALRASADFLTLPPLSPLDSDDSAQESYSVHNLCKVCGDKSHGRHYDVRTCKACAIFFQRWHKVGKSYACHGGREHECLINKKSRKLCIPCRLKKCIDVGMNEHKLQPLHGTRKSPQRRYTDEADQEEDSLSSPTALRASADFLTLPPLSPLDSDDSAQEPSTSKKLRLELNVTDPQASVDSQSLQQPCSLDLEVAQQQSTSQGVRSPETATIESNQDVAVGYSSNNNKWDFGNWESLLIPASPVASCSPA